MGICVNLDAGIYIDIEGFRYEIIAKIIDGKPVICLRNGTKLFSIELKELFYEHE